MTDAIVSIGLDPRAAVEGTQRYTRAIDDAITRTRNLRDEIQLLNRTRVSTGTTGGARTRGGAGGGAGAAAGGFTPGVQGILPGLIPLGGGGGAGGGAGARRTPFLGGSGTSLGALLGVGATAATISRSIQGFTDIEDALVGVGRTANLTDDELEDLFTNLSASARSDLPVATAELIRFAEVAGQVGITGSRNIEAFAETFGALSVATNIAGEDSARALARLVTVSQESFSNIDRLGSVITELGNSFAATETEIVNSALLVASSTQGFNVSAADATALGTSFAALGIQTELAGSTSGRAFREIDRALREGSQTLSDVVSLTGLTTEQFQELFEDNAAQGFLTFLQGLQQVIEAGGDVSGVLDDLNLSGVRLDRTLPALASNSELVARALRTSADEFERNEALSREAERANQTLSASLQRLGNEFSDFNQRVLGSASLGSFVDNIADSVAVLSGATLNQGIEQGFTRAEQASRNFSEEINRTANALESAVGEDRITAIRDFEAVLADLSERTSSGVFGGDDDFDDNLASFVARARQTGNSIGVELGEGIELGLASQDNIGNVIGVSPEALQQARSAGQALGEAFDPSQFITQLDASQFLTFTRGASIGELQGLIDNIRQQLDAAAADAAADVGENAAQTDEAARLDTARNSFRDFSVDISNRIRLIRQGGEELARSNFVDDFVQKAVAANRDAGAAFAQGQRLFDQIESAQFEGGINDQIDALERSIQVQERVDQARRNGIAITDALIQSFELEASATQDLTEEQQQLLDQRRELASQAEANEASQNLTASIEEQIQQVEAQIEVEQRISEARASGISVTESVIQSFELEAEAAGTLTEAQQQLIDKLRELEEARLRAAAANATPVDEEFGGNVRDQISELEELIGIQQQRNDLLIQEGEVSEGAQAAIEARLGIIGPLALDQVEALDQLKAKFDELGELESIESAERDLKRIGNTAKAEIAGNVGRSLAEVAIAGEDAREVTKDFLLDLANLAAQIGQQFLFNQLEGNGGATFGSAFGGLFGGGSARGNVLQGGNIVPHQQGGFVNDLQVFPLADGRIGSVAENGNAEAVLEPVRDSSGNLGVRNVGGNGPSSVINVSNIINVPDVDGVNRSRRQAIDDNLNKISPGA